MLSIRERRRKMNNLYHHGVKGQKWGVRRYQNADGSLTSAGKRRMGQISDNSKKVSFDEKTGKIDSDSENLGRAKSGIHQTVANDYSNASNIARSAGSIAKSASTISRQSADSKRQKEMQKIDVSHMSNKELRDAIDRMNLERNYKSLATEHVSSGRDHVSSILSTAGEVLAIGASAASIMMAIHQLKS